MKKVLKITGYLFLIVILLVVALAVTASLSQNKIVDIALKEISENISADVEIDEVSFTLLKKFPFATFEFSGIKIGNAGHFSPGNTAFKQEIATIGHAFISVKTKPLLDGKFEIIKVDLENTDLFYYTDTLGKTNLDFLMQKDTSANDDTSSANIPVVDISSLEIENLSISYINDSLLATADLFMPNLELTGKMKSEDINIEAKGDLRLTNMSYDSTTIHLMNQIDISYHVSYLNDTVALEELNLVSDELKFSTNGMLILDSVLNSKLTISKAEIDLGALVKYLPPQIITEYGLVEVGGELSLFGNASGALLDSLLPYVDMNFQLKNGQLFTEEYPGLEQLNFSGNYNNGEFRNNASTKIHFDTFWTQTKSSNAKACFTVKNLDNPDYSLHSQLTISLEEFQPWIPDTLVSSISGKILATVSTQGTLPDSITDNFINTALNQSKMDVQFQNLTLQNDTLEVLDLFGKLSYKPGNFKVDGFSMRVPSENIAIKNTVLDLDLTGPLTDVNALKMGIKKLHFESPQGILNATGSLHNLSYPEFKLDGNLNLNLSELKSFVPDTLIKDLSGDVYLTFTTAGKIHPDSIETQVNEILFQQTQFSLNVNDLSATLPDTLMQVSAINGNIHWKQDSISIHQFSGKVVGLPIKMDSISIINAYKTVLQNKDEMLLVKGNLEVGDIDHRIFDVLPPITEEATDALQPDSIDTPTNYTFNLKGKLAINSFTYDHAFINKLADYLTLDDSTTHMLNSYLRDEILVDNISTKFNIKDSLSLLEDFNLQAFGGELNTSVRYRLYADSIERINIRNVADKLDLKKLLYECNSFGQEEMISYKNIKGLLSTDIYTLIYLDKGNFISENTRVKGDLKLEDGGVFDYKPAMEMSKVPGLKDLENIQFKTLESNIFMFKNKFYVPKTHIISTVMDITAFGMQSQTVEYEYHLQFPLGDVLTGKSKKLLAKQADRGDDVSEADIERKTFNLIYAHVNGNKRVGKVGEKAIEAMRVKIKTQQEILDFIFKPELISFDSGIK